MEVERLSSVWHGKNKCTNTLGYFTCIGLFTERQVE